ncbi:MAG: hypothetical protein ABIA78_03415 [archaeon]
MDIKSILFGIAILILTIFVVVYGVGTFYSAPEYEDFCGEFKTVQVIEDEAQCLDAGGKWNPQDIRCVTTPCPQGFCDKDFSCREDYDFARESYYKTLFLITLPLGIALIVVGALVFGLEAVGAGLMGGGVATIIWGVGGYWQYSENLLKFILSLLGLIIIIGVSYWFSRREGKRK